MANDLLGARLCLFLGTRDWSNKQFKSQINTRRIRAYYVKAMSKEETGNVFESIPEYVFPQNMDLPPVLPLRKKRPYVRPIKLVLQESRRIRKLGLRKHFYDAPRNGLLVERLIPVAYEVMKQLAILEEGVDKLMDKIPVYACSCCKEVHIGASGHLIRSCKGSGCDRRKGVHAWIRGYTADVLIPVDCYHILDRLGPPILHEQRFSVPRVCAITELCIQAGYEHPDYPVVRWARVSGRQVGSGKPQVPETKLLKPYTGLPGQYGHPNDDDIISRLVRRPLDDRIQSPEDEVKDSEQIENEEVKQMEPHKTDSIFDEEKDELVSIAERTLHAFHTVRKGVQLLMKSYPMKACGYCTEVHIGPRVHRVKICGAFKHNQRHGKHGWQEAALSDIFPPNFVWHVPSGHSPALRPELIRFYGQTPAVVELCVQAGARIPAKWKPFMRTDVVIPELDEKPVVY